LSVPHVRRCPSPPLTSGLMSKLLYGLIFLPFNEPHFLFPLPSPFFLSGTLLSPADVEILLSLYWCVSPLLNPPLVAFSATHRLLFHSGVNRPIFLYGFFAHICASVMSFIFARPSHLPNLKPSNGTIREGTSPLFSTKTALSNSVSSLVDRLFSLVGQLFRFLGPRNLRSPPRRFSSLVLLVFGSFSRRSSHPSAGPTFPGSKIVRGAPGILPKKRSRSPLRRLLFPHQVGNFFFLLSASSNLFNPLHNRCFHCALSLF